MVLGVSTAPPVGEFTADLWMTSYETTIFLGEGAEGVLRPYHPRQLRESDDDDVHRRCAPGADGSAVCPGR